VFGVAPKVTYNKYAPFGAPCLILNKTGDPKSGAIFVDLFISATLTGPFTAVKRRMPLPVFDNNFHFIVVDIVVILSFNHVFYSCRVPLPREV
ncbi:MAG: hypothetical protein HGJ94_00090, partial [Desulfosarcina sp.]|nr:hypothetical protein [Desulfosarcina sp.]